MVYAVTLSESQRVMIWQLILEYLGPNIHQMYGVDNIVADTLSRIPSTSINKSKPFTRKSQCHANYLFAIDKLENNKDCFPLNILIVQREEQKEPINRNSKLSTYILYQVSGYSRKDLNYVNIICYDSKIYLPQTLHIRVRDWYHFYLNHPGGSRLEKTIGEVCYWKDLVMRSELYAKPCKICQQFKNRNNIYEYLSPKNITELKTWGFLHVVLIVPYNKSIIKQ